MYVLNFIWPQAHLSIWFFETRAKTRMERGSFAWYRCFALVFTGWLLQGTFCLFFNMLALWKFHTYNILLTAKAVLGILDLWGGWADVVLGRGWWICLCVLSDIKWMQTWSGKYSRYDVFFLKCLNQLRKLF